MWLLISGACSAPLQKRSPGAGREPLGEAPERTELPGPHALPALEALIALPWISILGPVSGGGRGGRASPGVWRGRAGQGGGKALTAPTRNTESPGDRRAQGRPRGGFRPVKAALPGREVAVRAGRAKDREGSVPRGLACGAGGQGAGLQAGGSVSGCRRRAKRRLGLRFSDLYPSLSQVHGEAEKITNHILFVSKGRWEEEGVGEDHRAAPWA